MNENSEKFRDHQTSDKARMDSSSVWLQSLVFPPPMDSEYGRRNMVKVTPKAHLFSDFIHRSRDFSSLSEDTGVSCSTNCSLLTVQEVKNQIMAEGSR